MIEVMETSPKTPEKISTPFKLQETIRESLEQYMAIKADAEAVMETHRNKIRQLSQMAAIHNAYCGLANVWQQDDPGKYAVAYFLCKNTGEERAVIREMVPVPFQLRFAFYTDPAHIWRQDCPGCKASIPVIMSYHQTEDGPTEDTWQKTWNIYCRQCNLITQIREPEESGTRFLR